MPNSKATYGTVLITGAAGFVGRNLVEFFARRGTVVGVDLREGGAMENLKQEILDLRDARAVEETVGRVRPGVVIHVAGNKNVRNCQEKPAEAMVVNGEATGHVARACAKVGARLIYLSTDLVFDSNRGHYREEEVPGTTLVYGQSKRRGEVLAMEALEDAIVCRSGGIYGRNSPLLHWLEGELKAGKKVECFTDVYNTPTYVVNLAEMMVGILAGGLKGIFHTVGSERVNRYEFFRAYCECVGFPEELLVPTECGAAREKLLLRPDSSLDCAGTRGRLEKAGIAVGFDTVDDGFSRIKRGEGF